MSVELPKTLPSNEMLLTNEWLPILQTKSGHYLSGVFDPKWTINEKLIANSFPLGLDGKADHGRMIFSHNIGPKTGYPKSPARDVARRWISNEEYRNFDVLSIGRVDSLYLKTNLGTYLNNIDQPGTKAYSAQFSFAGPAPDLGGLKHRGPNNYLVWNILLSHNYASKLLNDVKKCPDLMLDLLERTHKGILNPQIKYATKGLYIFTKPLTSKQTPKDLLSLYKQKR